MGFIREPEGIDFVINSGTLTDSDRQEISEYIKDCKLKLATNGSKKKSRSQNVRLTSNSSMAIRPV